MLLWRAAEALAKAGEALSVGDASRRFVVFVSDFSDSWWTEPSMSPPPGERFRGTEVGGNCVELEEGGARLVLDLGWPLGTAPDADLPLPLGNWTWIRTA